MPSKVKVTVPELASGWADRYSVFALIAADFDFDCAALGRRFKELVHWLTAISIFLHVWSAEDPALA